MPNINYWSNRKEREEHAVHHTMLMEQLYKEETDDTVHAVKFTVLILSSRRMKRDGLKLFSTLLMEEV